MSVKIALRDSAARLLFLARVTSPRRRARGKLSIATFHRVLPESDRRAYPFPGLAVTPKELHAFLGYFHEHFDCGTLAAQHERLARGDERDRPLLALTFDDASHDNWRYARPLLARHGLKASFFAPVAAVERGELLWHDRLGFAVLSLLGQRRGGREQLDRILVASGLPGTGPETPAQTAVREAKSLTPQARLRLVEELTAAAGNAPNPEFARPMTFGELAELAADGHEIGSHSMTHCMLPECDDRALAYETRESRRVLAAKLGQPIESFCYPNGDSDARSARAVADAGYRRAVTTDWGRNGPRADPFRLRRCDMDARRVLDRNGGLAPALLAFRMSGLYPGLG